VDVEKGGVVGGLRESEVENEEEFFDFYSTLPSITSITVT
jgi:hypothetical protein